MENDIIREATIDDFPSVQKLYHSLFLNEHKRDTLIDTTWPLQKGGEQFLRHMIYDENAICFVAQVQNRIIGFLIGSLLKHDPIRPGVKAQLISIFVEEPFRNRLFGSSLINRFLIWAREHEAKRVSVVVQHDNNHGKALYKRLGFSDHLVILEQHL